MKFILVSLIILSPTLSAQTIQPMDSRCYGPEPFKMSDEEIADTATQIRDAMEKQSNGECSANYITMDTRLSQCGGFGLLAGRTLNRRLRAIGLHEDSIIRLEEIDRRRNELSVRDLVEIIRHDWIEIYCGVRPR